MKKLIAMLLASVCMTAHANAPVYGPELQGFEYPAPLAHFEFAAQGQTLRMAYLDYQPEQPNGHSVVLMHGKNFIDSMSTFGQKNPLKVLAMTIVYWLIVWPYLVMAGMKLALGTNATLAILFGRKNSAGQ